MVAYCRSKLLQNAPWSILQYFWPATQKEHKIGIQYRLSLNAGQKNCRIGIEKHFFCLLRVAILHRFY